METVLRVFCAMWALASAITTILIWRRWPDPSSRLLKWSILLWPCAGGLVGSLGGLLMSLGRSGTLEVVGETLLGVMLVAIVAHWCLLTVYIVGRLSRQDGRGDKSDRGLLG